MRTQDTLVDHHSAELQIRALHNCLRLSMTTVPPPTRRVSWLLHYEYSPQPPQEKNWAMHKILHPIRHSSVYIQYSWSNLQKEDENYSSYRAVFIPAGQQSKQFLEKQFLDCCTEQQIWIYHSLALWSFLIFHHVGFLGRLHWHSTVAWEIERHYPNRAELSGWNAPSRAESQSLILNMTFHWKRDSVPCVNRPQAVLRTL